MCMDICYWNYCVIAFVLMPTNFNVLSYIHFIQGKELCICFKAFNIKGEERRLALHLALNAMPISFLVSFLTVW